MSCVDVHAITFVCTYVNLTYVYLFLSSLVVPNLEVQSFIAVYENSSLQKVELQLSGQVKGRLGSMFP